jgi:hypothetical protein
MMHRETRPPERRDPRPLSATDPRRAVRLPLEQPLAQARLQPTIYLPSRSTDPRHTA